MYDFRNLSPLDFEDLARDLLQAEFGLLFESFGPGPDSGIDFRFAATGGAVIVQAKHYADSRSDALLRAARAENRKVALLKPARYIFITSTSLTQSFKTRLQQAMPAAPLAQGDIFGRKDLNNLLSRHENIHRKHFKLWLSSIAVLERILHSGVYNRTKAEMDIIKSIVPKFVQNDSVSQAQTILQDRGALVIAGEPGVGKSTLARVLIWLHAEQGWNISVIDNISEAFEITNEDGKRLVFFDDFLGQIQVSQDLIRSTDQRLPPFLQRVKTNKNLRFVMTTRDYILRQAQEQSSRLSAASFNAAEFTLSVGHYTRAARAQMLYNHIYFADISADERDDLLKDDFFLEIIDHRNFNPRLIDFLTTADYVSIADTPIRDSVRRVLENPQELWEKPYRSHITAEGRGVMLALFFNESRVPIAPLESAFQRMVQSMGLPIARADIPVRFRAALRELEGSVLAIEERVVRFSNPGILDFLRRAVIEDKCFIVGIEAVLGFGEIRSTWDLYWRAFDRQTCSKADIAAWDSAICRLMRAPSGTALDRFAFAIDTYDRLETEISLEFVQAATLDLGTAEIDTSERSLCGYTLEMLALSILPYDVQRTCNSVLSGAVARLLSQNADSLSLEDIDGLAATLSEYGADNEGAAKAHGDALRLRATDLRAVLRDYVTVDELNVFETELKQKLISHEIPIDAIADQFDNRRVTLREREKARESQTYNPVQSSSSQLMTTDQIRSMFSGLNTI